MFSNSSHTTRTYHYSSSGGPGGTTVTQTRTVTGPDGRRTETKTFGGGGHQDIGGISSGFGRIHFSGGDSDRGTRTYIMGKRSQPTESRRYSKGWRSRRDKPEPMQLEGKTYNDIKAECKAKGILFEDPDFPAVDSSIFFSRSPPRPFVWKRPHEIVSDPRLFVGGASRFDINQGELGDCWLLAAIASLCQHKELLYRVVPNDQNFQDDYAGVFHFQFWQYGKWTDVIIDDRLPTYNNKLTFMHSVSHNEFWSALLEKAYAKLTGSYEALKGGSTNEAMTDFTGGVTETFNFKEGVPPKLFLLMLKAHQRDSLMGCSIEAKPGEVEAKLTNGLIMGHAYSITDVRLVGIKTSKSEGKLPMVRIRNPWGNECEWTGAWSDKSQEWRLIPEDERKKMGLTFDDDGEFWMSFQDFTKNFEKLEICNLGPDSLAEKNAKKRWEASNKEGAWRKKSTAGGCRNYINTFASNPQYRVEVVDADDDDDEDKGTIIVGLMQKNRRKLKKEGQDLLTVGYVIYKLKGETGRTLDTDFFKYNASVAKSPAFINLREVCGRHKLDPGCYCILPSTFAPDEEGDFLLRIFSEKPNNSREIDEETGMSDVQKGTKDPQAPKPLINNNYKPRPASTNAGRSVVQVQDRDDGRPPSEKPAGRAPVPTQQLTEQDIKQDKAMREAFKKISGVDLEIDAYELQGILDHTYKQEFKFDGFSADTCRSMVAMMDLDRSGKLGYDEFKVLWNDLRLWKSVFKKFDTDRSGKFDSHELRRAFRGCGFSVSNGTFNALVQRYSHRDGGIYFDDYIHCVCRLKTMFETFREMDTNNTGNASFSLDEFIQTTMYS